MNLSLLLPLLITTVVAIVGWFAAHRLSSARDRVNKRREERIRYLIGAYRSLSKAIEHKRLYEIADEVQTAVADVQLFGTTEQIRKVQRIAYEMGHRQETSMDDLLLDLRNDLRQELNLPAVQGRIWWLRITPKQSEEDRTNER